MNDEQYEHFQEWMWAWLDGEEGDMPQVLVDAMPPEFGARITAAWKEYAMEQARAAEAERQARLSEAEKFVQSVKARPYTVASAAEMRTFLTSKVTYPKPPTLSPAQLEDVLAFLAAVTDE